MRSNLRFAILLPLLFAGLAIVNAQDDEFPSAQVTAAFDGPVKPGATAELKFAVAMTPGFWGYHKDTTLQGYGFPPAVHFGELHGLELKKTHWPEAERKVVDADWVELIYRDRFTLTFEFQVPEGMEPGEYKITGRFEMQVCDDDG
jgi:DsbC/DsbD-like thiol-disulfide interchange protein